MSEFSPDVIEEPASAPEPAEVAARILAMAADGGGWTVEATDAMMALTGATITPCDEVHNQPTDDHVMYNWDQWVTVLGERVWLKVHGWEDPTPEEPDRWFWYVDVWSDPTKVEGLIQQWRPEDRAAMLELVTVLFNVSDLTASVKLAAN